MEIIKEKDCIKLLNEDCYREKFVNFERKIIPHFRFDKY